MVKVVVQCAVFVCWLYRRGKIIIASLQFFRELNIQLNGRGRKDVMLHFLIFLP